MEQVGKGSRKKGISGKKRPYRWHWHGIQGQHDRRTPQKKAAPLRRVRLRQNSGEGYCLFWVKWPRRFWA